MKLPFASYQGDEPFVFVSYSHADSERVFKELLWLHEAGINIWYDEGITPGERWPQALATAIDRCALFLVFLTEESVRSDNCSNEIDYALKRGRPFLSVQLVPVELPPGMELNIGNRQAILKYNLSESQFREKLLEAIGNPARVRVDRPPPAARKARSNLPLRSLVGAALVVAAIAVAAYLYRSDSSEPASVAVLPFQSMSADGDYGYLADGLADELINQLGRVPGLGVSSRTSSFYYKNFPPLMEDIRQRLGVAHALEGSLRRDGGRITINTNLFETRTGRQIWSDSVATDLDKLSEVPARIARQIANILLPRDAALGEEWLGPAEGVNAAAYDAYLQGLDYLRRPPAPEVLTAATLHFDRSVSEDPAFARGYAALCETHLAFYRMARTEDATAHFAAAENYCEEALALDNTLWEGRQSLATLYRHVGRYEEALDEIRLADALRPDTASIHHEFGKILAELDQPDRAEGVLRRAIDLDPGFWGGYADLGDFLYSRGRYEEALEQFVRVYELTPDNGLALVSLGAAHYMLDDLAAAERVFRQAVTEHPGSESRAYWQAATWLGITHYYQGCFEQAAFWQSQAIRVSPNDHRLWGRLAESCQLQSASRASAASVAAYARAIELADAELDNNPQDWETLGLLALYQARSGNGGDRQMISRMLELQPGNPDALEVALLYANATGDDPGQAKLIDELRALGFPQRMLARNPFLSEPQACSDDAGASERLICTQENVNPTSSE